MAELEVVKVPEGVDGMPNEKEQKEMLKERKKAMEEFKKAVAGKK